ncbi:MAG: triose-phosphate isomerase [Dysosmobacter sp.]
MPRAKWCDVVVCVPCREYSRRPRRPSRTCGCPWAPRTLFYEEKGAYTGEVSAEYAAEGSGRQVCHRAATPSAGNTSARPTSPSTRRCMPALEAGLHPIICVGESLEQRELGVTMRAASPCRSSPLWPACRRKSCAASGHRL